MISSYWSCYSDNKWWLFHINDIAEIFCYIVSFKPTKDRQMFYLWTLFSVSAADASPVKNFACDGPNKTHAELILSWTSPKGQYTNFKITGSNIEDINSKGPCNPNCTHTISKLKHYTPYNLNLMVESCGLPSTSVPLNCKTGITSRKSFFLFPLQLRLLTLNYLYIFCNIWEITQNLILHLHIFL